ncbi:glycoside hydrolase family 130 protein [bacterium]|nr:glycoside hydrolase family 130 protein [bacterium]
MYYEEFILKRYSGNPIIKPKDFPGAQAIMNPGQTMYDGKTILLVSVVHRSGLYRGKEVGSTTHVAESTDGIHFEINPDPFLQGIDTRVTKIEDTYYIVNPGGPGGWGTYGVLHKTKDFKKCEYIETISLPDNRVPSLFPEKIKGKYMRVDRPYRVNTPLWTGFGNLWISSSPDLIHWGCHRPLLKAGEGNCWGGIKIGPTPPIKTEAGWLMITHGVSASTCGLRYRLGAILMDLDDPTKIIGKTRSYILAPYEQYELCGRVPNVVFTCGAIPDYDKDQIRVYYGCADTCIGLATGSLSELVNACLKEL